MAQPNDVSVQAQIRRFEEEIQSIGASGPSTIRTTEEYAFLFYKILDEIEKEADAPVPGATSEELEKALLNVYELACIVTRKISVRVLDVEEVEEPLIKLTVDYDTFLNGWIVTIDLRTEHRPLKVWETVATFLIKLAFRLITGQEVLWVKII